MKYSLVFVASAALVAAQLPSSIPACGQTCITNMLNAAPDLGCATNNITCLCANADFGYGLRDCANEACGTSVEAIVASYGVSICSVAGITAGGAGSAASTGAGGASGSSVPVSTEAVVTTISSGSSAVTTSTIGSTTIYSAVGQAGVASLSGSAASAAGSVSAELSSAAAAASSATGSAGSAAGSAASAAGSAASSASAAASSKASSGLAPVMTAAPVLGGAALAALLML